MRVPSSSHLSRSPSYGCTSKHCSPSSDGLCSTSLSPARSATWCARDQASISGRMQSSRSIFAKVHATKPRSRVVCTQHAQWWLRPLSSECRPRVVLVGAGAAARAAAAASPLHQSAGQRRRSRARGARPRAGAQRLRWRRPLRRQRRQRGSTAVDRRACGNAAKNWTGHPRILHLVTVYSEYSNSASI